MPHSRSIGVDAEIFQRGLSRGAWGRKLPPVRLSFWGKATGPQKISKQAIWG